MARRTIPDSLKECAVSLVNNQRKTPQEAADLLAVSLSVIRRALQNYRAFGVVSNPSLAPPGRKRLLTGNDLQYIRNALDANPCLYLDEIQSKLHMYCNVDVSISTLSRTIKRLKISHKQASRQASERDEAARLAFRTYVATHLQARQLVFIDEGAKDERIADRRFGWSEVGKKCIVHSAADCGRRFSVLPVLGMDGILACEVIEGGYTGELFADFIRNHLLPRTNPFPQDCSVVVLDNCTAHHSEGIRELLEAAGRRVLYLPTYSPDLNPDECVFSFMKSWLRRYADKFQHSPSLADPIIEAISDISPEMARAWILHCGYM